MAVKGNWDEIVPLFFEEMRGLRSPLTLKPIAKELKRFQEFSSLAPQEVQPSHLEDYLLYQSQRPGVSLATAWGYVIRLASFFRWAAKREFILWNPAQDLKMPLFTRDSKRSLNVREVESLIAQSKPGSRDVALLEFFYGTGLRLQEVCLLNVEDLDLERRQVEIHQGKGGSPRLAPLGPRLVSVLGQYLKETRPRLANSQTTNALWLNYQGQRLGRNGLAKVVSKNAKLAGLGLVSPHQLRHAYATHLVEGGASLRMVQVLLGHRSLQSTQVYTKILPIELMREFRRTHPRARRRA